MHKRHHKIEVVAPLPIMGKIQDEDDWQKNCADYPDAPVEYLRFLTTTEVQKQIRGCPCPPLLMRTPWMEAFGKVPFELN
ncbi:MAG: hypothetical protein ACBR12_26510 [Microcoleus sp.]|uniref:hypothetical protein n=1 Tax=Microcoleus sp. TaxID=44472 RepID=UPI0035262A76